MEKTTLSKRQLEIMQTAGKILANHGVSGLTTKKLAAEIGFSESALYRHFSSKEEIIINMLDFLAEDMKKRLSSIIDRSDAESSFINLFNEQFRFFNANPYNVAAVFSEGLLEKSEAINKSILNIMSVKRRLLKKLIEDGKKQDVFTQNLPTEQMVNIIIGTFRLLMFKWRVSNFSLNIIEEGTEMIDSLLILIKNK